MKWISGISLILAVLLASCGKRSIEIDRHTRHAIDTLSAKQIVILRPEIDSLCEAQFDSLRMVAIDSILQVRRHEINKILGR